MTTLADIAAARASHPDWYPDPADPLDVNWNYGGENGDTHVEAREPAEAIVMDFNPGAGRRAKAGQISASEKAWRTRCIKLTEGFCRRFVFAELIPTSSHSQAELRTKHHDFGPAMAAGAAVNKKVMGYHSPALRIIFQVGIGYLPEVAREYGLVHVATEPRPAHPTQLLLQHFTLPQSGIPWIAFRHFASRGFSNADFNAIRDYARRVMHD